MHLLNTLTRLCLLAVTLAACSRQPSKNDITKKLLSEHTCPDKAILTDMKILRTEERRGTHQPRVFIYTIRGEVDWPNGCPGEPNLAAGAKKRITQNVTLTETAEGWQ